MWLRWPTKTPPGLLDGGWSGLRVGYRNPDGSVTRPVDGVSLRIQTGEIAAILGESGCGRSTTALALMRLIAPPGRIAAGRILLRGEDLTALVGFA